MRFKLWLCACVLAVLGCGAKASDVGFVEDFALAEDRAKALAQLIPGTEDYYFYHCLHLQQTGALDKVDELVTVWVKRHGRTARVEEILNRQALLTYEKDPQKSLAYIRLRLGLQYNHAKDVLNAKPNLPVKLDPAQVSYEAFSRIAMQNNPKTLAGFTDTALDSLAAQALGGEQRRELLRRLKRSDLPNLPKLVVDDLNFEHSSGFGSIPIHRQLLKTQLDEVLKLRPTLLNEQQFVTTYLLKLQPGADVDLSRDLKEREAYLDRLWNFAQQLNPAHNALKAHILYNRLALSRSQGKYNRERFMEYLKLPRRVFYMNDAYMQRAEHRDYSVNLNENFADRSLLAAIATDEPLVREFLMQFFVADDNFAPFAEYLRDDYLKQVFAETKIVNGLGDMEKWYSMLNDPARYQALKDRIDLDFAPTNKPFFKAGDAVSLDLDIKNVKTLLVKVFEINTLNYYKQHKREVDSGINLDGLVANEEKTYTYEDPPLRRARRHFDFPALKNPGVYVIEFIGNGMSSRALVCKGQLRFLERTGTAGHIFNVLDEDNKTVAGARLMLDGHDYTSDKNGDILAPFSAKPGEQQIILIHDNIASLGRFSHKAESYKLAAGFYVDRESLLKRRKAKVLVRPSLTINGVPATVALLEEVTLTIQSVNRDGIASGKTAQDFKLFNEKESEYEFLVPENLRSLTFSLTAKVKSISENKKLDLGTAQPFNLNLIDSTEKTQSLLMEKTEAGHALLLLGKTGEPRADQPIVLSVTRRDFSAPMNLMCQSDAVGRVTLGALEGVTRLSCNTADGQNYEWILAQDDHNHPSTINGKAGQTLRVAYMGREKQPTRAAFALLESRKLGAVFVSDFFDSLGLADGFLELKNLPAGDYELFLKESDDKISVHVADGELRDGYVLATHRQLEVLNPDPLQISALEAAADTVKIQLKNATASTRVHVIATRLLPAYSVFNQLGTLGGLEPEVVTVGGQDSTYLTGRNIGDEYRYILERRYAAKFPGNMLQRPALLLNPFALTPTQSQAFEADGGGGFGSRNGGGRRLSTQSGGGAKQTESASGNVANLDYLPEGALVLANLAADKDGVISVARKDLGGRFYLRVVAANDANTVCRSLALPAAPWAPLDLRLAAGLDPAKHYTEQKQITLVEAGKALAIDDVGASNVEPYDTLAKLHGLFSTLSGDPRLAEFRFILDWPKLKPEEKRANYSKYACHELSFFLSRKDPEFFKTVILPYLQNKKDKTFLDRYLLNEDLSEYLKPWAREQLNVAEQILLCERVQAARENTARDVKDRHDLLPPDMERFNHLFKTALQGSALETEGRLAKQMAERQKNIGNTALEALREDAVKSAEAGDHFETKDMPAAKPAALAAAEPEPSKADGKMMDSKKKSGGRKEMEKGEPAARRRDAPADDMDKREEARKFFQTLPTTEELAENNYYKLPIGMQKGGLVAPNAFWTDYAAHVGAGKAAPFLSANIAEASHGFTEMMFALAVTDLPFEAGKHETDFKGARLTINAKSHLIAYHKEIKECAAAEKSAVLISQNFYRADDRFRFENNERFDKYITDEFLMQTVYGCQVVLTNPTSSQQKLDVMLQIPRGALPVQNGFFTKGQYLRLEPYSTATIEYYFYFPAEGEFAHYPAHVARNGKLLASAAAVTLKSVRKLTKVDTESWDYISQFGTPVQVEAFLKANNLHRVNLDRIAWRMKDAEFFKRTLDLLQNRHVYNNTLWSYGLLHDAPDASREFLAHQDGYLAQCGLWLASKLVTIDPVSRQLYQHLEYSPLVNARAHRLGKERKILNDRFFEQYIRLMEILKYKPALDDADRLAVAYYLLLQDRIEDGMAFFKRVDAAKLATRMQYDYTRAYLDFFTDAHAQARQIAQAYKDHPVDRWRNRFADVLNQLDEAEGKAARVADGEDRAQAMDKLAAAAPGFDFKIEARKIVLNYQNLAACEARYYPMDIELLFSGNPFVREVSGQFGFVRPVKTETLKLAENGRVQEFEIPKEFQTANVMVEISAAGDRKSQAYYANSLALQVIENYGQIKVSKQKDAAPAPKVYVKVYAKMRDGAVKFYKDGYTDLRGRFDYASLSTNDLDNVEKFSMLVMSETDGAMIREAAPPKR
jgi:hypothetical protein